MHFILLLLTLFITACSGTDETLEIEDNTQTAQQIFEEANQSLENGGYLYAAQLYEELERQYPYADQAVEAQVNAAYAYYKAKRYDEAAVAADRFISLHPANEQVSYALYVKALSFYEQISDVKRDQEMTELALEGFTALINRFPDSKYARDAQFKRDLTLDHLAGKEMEIGRYYLKREQIHSAINRFQSVVEVYETTSHTPEALHRLVEAYLSLGLKAQATEVAAILGYNYPDTKWYKRSYTLLDPSQRQQLASTKGWFRKKIESLLD